MPPVAVNVVVLPEQMAVVPVIPVGAVGAVLTVKVAGLDVAAGEQVPETIHWY